VLHVAQISFFTDPDGRRPEQLLAAWPSLVDVAEAAYGAGVRVSVIQASSHSLTLTRSGVSYCFLPFGRGSPSSPDDGAFTALLHELAPDVFHVHGLSFPRDVLSLARLAPDAAIVVQDHADRPPRFWRRLPWRRCSRVVSGVSFCSREQARPFMDAGLLRQQTRIYEIPESSSRFTLADREAARRAAQVHGEPVVLWVGHLNENKDPLTVLAGISAAAGSLPGLQLYCCFGTAPLLHEVEHRIATDPALTGRVHLLGPVPHARVEELMRAADIFVLGSHRESTGYALIEAFACGASPVVTDIPAFRSLTCGAQAGKLWPRGDAHALAEALRATAAAINSDTRASMRAHFERELSFHAMGSKLVAMYRDAAERKRGRSDCSTLARDRTRVGAL
jgi:glycosyltransferase involved in cell wall biosynthesis